MIEIKQGNLSKSPTIGALTKALIQFHSNVSKVAKGSENPYFKSKYGDLNAYLSVVKQPLIDARLVVIQLPESNGLTTILSHESGEYISSTMQMRPSKDDPQGHGSALTYMRRYMLASILGLNAEDDDGNRANEKHDRQSIIKEIKSLYRDDMPEPQKVWFSQIDSQTDTQLCNALTKLKG